MAISDVANPAVESRHLCPFPLPIIHSGAKLFTQILPRKDKVRGCLRAGSEPKVAETDLSLELDKQTHEGRCRKRLSNFAVF
jgi:hypothetical protein